MPVGIDEALRERLSVSEGVGGKPVGASRGKKDVRMKLL